jgi:carbamate kinase
MSRSANDPVIEELFGPNFFPERAQKPKHMDNVSVVRVKAAHHRIAQLIATGASYIDVALTCGYTPQYISNLATGNPAFQELVSHYTRAAEAEMLDLRAKQARLGELAVDELTDRLAENPEQFAIRDLLDVVEVNGNKPRLMEAQKGWTQSGPPSPITISFVTAGGVGIETSSIPTPKIIEGDHND